jgi:cytochrome P450
MATLARATEKKRAGIRGAKSNEPVTQPSTIMAVLTSPSVEDIPIYREGATDEESARLVEQDPVGFHLRAYQAMGPVYRTQLGQKMVVMFAGLESNDFIWKNTDLWTYRNLLGAFREELGQDHVTAIDGAHHRQKRTILKPAFDQAPAMRYLPQFNALFHEEVGKTSAMEKVDTVHWWARTICLVQSKTVARTEISEEELEQFVAWEKLLLNGIRLGEERITYYNDPDYLRMKATVLGLMGRMVDERLAEPEKYDDNFAMVMQARLAVEGDAVSRENLIDDLYLVLLAGVENTSKLISTALLCTLRDPVWLAALREELDPWDGKDVMALSQMNRLKATVMECQRLYPSVVLNVRESVRDFEFAGHHLPAGTVLMHMQTLCQYRDEFYDDPLKFKPERFVENGRFAAKTSGFFGGGTHICLGRNFTLLQTPIALAQMLKYFDIDVVGEKSSAGEGPLQPGQFLKELWVRVRPRKS